MAVEFTMQLYPEPTFTQLDVAYEFTDDGTEGTYPIQNFRKVIKKWVHSIDKLKDRPQIGGVKIWAQRDLSKGVGVRRYKVSVTGLCIGCDWEEEFKMAFKRFPPSSYNSLTTLLSFQELHASAGAYPGTERTDKATAFVKGVNRDTIETITEWLAPGSREKANSMDTGTGFEAILLKGAVKDQKRTSLGHPGVQWKLTHTFLVGTQEDVRHF